MKLNHCGKYLRQRSFRWKVIGRIHTYTDTAERLLCTAAKIVGETISSELSKSRMHVGCQQTHAFSGRHERRCRRHIQPVNRDWLNIWAKRTSLARQLESLTRQLRRASVVAWISRRSLRPAATTSSTVDRNAIFASVDSGSRDAASQSPLNDTYPSVQTRAGCIVLPESSCVRCLTVNKAIRRQIG